jgi:hypothetical protein
MKLNISLLIFLVSLATFAQEAETKFAINNYHRYYADADVPNAKLPFIVLQNDTLVQAIQSTDKKITEVVLFTQISQLKAKNMTLSASAPCVILIESKGNEKLLSVNDPQMDANLKQIKIMLNGKTILVDMPQGELCGKPVTIKL